MIKNLLSIALVTASVAICAQTGKVAKPATSVNAPANISAKTQNNLTTVCDTISTFTGNSYGIIGATANTVVAGCFPNAGYVFGTNCYGDKEKANFFAGSHYSVVAQPSVTSVMVLFYGTSTNGTMGTASVTANLKLYAGTNVTTAPGAALGTSTANLGQIVAAHTNTASNVWAFTYNFSPAIAVPATGFFSSMTIPNIAGDTVVVVNEYTTSVNNNAWDMDASNNWANVDTSWNPNIKGNLAMFPAVCGNSVSVGISANSGLSKRVALMPNPSSGLVTISVSSPSQENLNVSVVNALGQVVSTSVHEAIANSNFPLDLTNQPNGVYFVTVSNGTDKMVQRLIINK